MTDDSAEQRGSQGHPHHMRRVPGVHLAKAMRISSTAQLKVGWCGGATGGGLGPGWS